MTNVSRYPKKVFWSEEDEGYIATAPDLPGSSAFGATEQQALKELDDAIVAWLEAAALAGNNIPAPSQPVKEDAYSGRILLRMPKSLHASLAVRANQEGVSLNQFLVSLVSGNVSAQVIEDISKALQSISNQIIHREASYEYRSLRPSFLSEPLLTSPDAWRKLMSSEVSDFKVLSVVAADHPRE